jgi:hypothetical protein
MLTQALETWRKKAGGCAAGKAVPRFQEPYGVKRSFSSRLKGAALLTSHWLVWEITPFDLLYSWALTEAAQSAAIPATTAVRAIRIFDMIFPPLSRCLD